MEPWKKCNGWQIQNHSSIAKILPKPNFFMCLWNTDAPGSNRVKICQPYNLIPALPKVYVMSVKCEHPLDELTVQVWLLYHHSNFNVSGTELCTDKQTGDPITSRPRQTFQAGGIKMQQIYYKLHSFLYTYTRERERERQREREREREHGLTSNTYVYNTLKILYVYLLYVWPPRTSFWKSVGNKKHLTVRTHKTVHDTIFIKVEVFYSLYMYCIFIEGCISG